MSFNRINTFLRNWPLDVRWRNAKVHGDPIDRYNYIYVIESRRLTVAVRTKSITVGTRCPAHKGSP